MATSGTKTNNRRCVKCDGTKGGGGGLFTCEGCQQMFCSRHVSEHRQELNLQLEDVMQEHDLIQQESTQLTPDQSVLEKINAWENESINKIREIAEAARADFQQCYQNVIGQIKKQCPELARNLRLARESDDFSESDLTKWNQILHDLKTQLESMTKINIIKDRGSCVDAIKVHHDVQSSSNTEPQNVYRPVRTRRSTDADGQESSLRNVIDQGYRNSRGGQPRNTSNRVNHARERDCKQQ